MELGPYLVYIRCLKTFVPFADFYVFMVVIFGRTFLLFQFVHNQPICQFFSHRSQIERGSSDSRFFADTSSRLRCYCTQELERSRFKFLIAGWVNVRETFFGSAAALLRTIRLGVG